MLANTKSMWAQGSCSTSILISNVADTTFAVNDSVLWINVVATDSFMDVRADISSSQRQINSIHLYSNTCNNLNQLAQVSGNYMHYNGLIIGNNYHLRITADSTVNDSIEVKYMLTPLLDVQINVSPIELCLGDSFKITDNTSIYNLSATYDYTWTYGGGAQNDLFSNLQASNIPIAPFWKTFTSVGSFYIHLSVHGYDPSGPIADFDDEDSVLVIVHDTVSTASINILSDLVCDSVFSVTDNSYNIKSGFGMPGGFPNGISWSLYEYNYSGFSFLPSSSSSNPNGIMHVSNNWAPTPEPLDVGQYAITMTAMGYCNNTVKDSINFFITGGTPAITGVQQVCIGDTAMFIGSSGCPDFWQWSFGDGSSGSGTNTVYHTYTQLGTYQVTLQTNAGGVFGYFNIEVVQTTVPIIKGYQNNCDSTVTYSIENYDPNYTYTWSTQIFNQTYYQYTSGQFIINGNTNVETANTASIDWYSATFPLLPNYIVITVEAQLNGSHCSAISTYKIYECCAGDVGTDAIYWHDTTITEAHILNGNYIAINGTVILKDSLVMNKYTGAGGIWFGPQAKLVLDTGGYFEIRNGNLRAGCEYMWDGVYATSPNEQIRIKSTYIESSINGIVSENGAPLYLDSSYFDNNLRSVQIKNYRRTSFFQSPLYYSGYVRGCGFNTLNGNPNYSTDYYTLWAPHQNDPSECGIYIENVEIIQIGDSNSLKNTFNRSRFAIMSYNSALKVYNNEFRYINDVTNTGWFSFVQGAVFVSNMNTSFPSVNYSKLMEIGKTGNAFNYFSNCHTALFANNTIARVSNNVVDSCNVGFRILDFKYHSRIDSNVINHTIEGILLHKPIGGYRNIKVRENNLPYSTVLKTGISVINVNSNYGDIAQLSNNTIRFLDNQNINHYGIKIQGCNGIKVNSNNIRRAGVSLGDIANNWDKMVGIKTAQSQGCQITDNYIYSMGTGIWTNGSCNLTQYSCNDLVAYKYGFYFGQLTTISEQGHLGTWNTHNKWSTSGAIAGNQKLATDAAFNNFNWSGDVKWYYGPNYISQYIPIQLNTVQPRILPYQNSTDNHYCVGTTTGTGTSTGGGSPTGGGSNSGTLAMLEDENIDPEVRDFLLEDIMQGLDYVDLLNEFRAYDAKFLYEMLATDTSLMWLGGENDIDYQEFFDSVRMSNIGDFTKVYDFIEAEDYHSADSMNNLIVPSSDIYTILKTVLSIYLNTWCKGNYFLLETEYNTLFEIANQTPYEGGDGVYTARIMINYNPDDYGVAFRLKPETVKDTDKEAIKLYPNPAQNMLNIEFENLTGEAISGVLKVFNLSGQLIFEKQLNTNNAFYMLDISSLTNGAYIFSIQINNSENTAYRHQSGKLIVLKP